ncbi:MAG: glycoside hydrolase family 140 protein [bacterium]
MWFAVVLLVAPAAYAQSDLRVSNDGHRLMTTTGRPFFWLGDTAWELIHRLTREDADMYLQRRAQQGFTVIQAVAIGELGGLTVPNAYGDLPLRNGDPTQPNDAYFRHVDYIVDRAAALGLHIGLLPTWGDKVFKNSWGVGPELFTPANARVYGRWLGMRYRNRANVIWILGGDRNPRPGSADADVWRAMAAGITEGVGGADNALMTFHPAPNRTGSGEWFHDDGWLDVNMFQTGHCRDGNTYDRIRAAYDRLPAKPVLDGEPIYEDHPVCFNAADLGTSSAYDVRKAAYLHLFAGAFGHTYGCHDIWQFFGPGREPVNGPHMTWQAALELPGASQMQYLRRLMESRPLQSRVPDQGLLIEADLTPSDRVQATRGADYAFVYSAAGKPFTVRLGTISGTALRTSWFDPRTGKVEVASTVENAGTRLFTPPHSGYGQDWVLVLDNDAKGYRLP